MAPIADVVIAAAKYAWAIKLGLFLISVVIYYFINERKREKLAESLELDPRIGAPFSGASHVFKAVALGVRPWVGFLRLLRGHRPRGIIPDRLHRLPS